MQLPIPSTSSWNVILPDLHYSLWHILPALRRTQHASTHPNHPMALHCIMQTQYTNNNWKQGKMGGARCSYAGASEYLRYELEARVTEQRLANVVSKTGRIDPSNRQGCRQLLDDFKRDVIDDLVDDSILPSAASLCEVAAELDEFLERAARMVVVRYVRSLLRQSLC